MKGGIPIQKFGRFPCVKTEVRPTEQLENVNQNSLQNKEMRKTEINSYLVVHGKFHGEFSQQISTSASNFHGKRLQGKYLRQAVAKSVLGARRRTIVLG